MSLKKDSQVKLVKVKQQGGRTHYEVRCTRSWEWITTCPTTKKFTNRKDAEQFVLLLLLKSQFR